MGSSSWPPGRADDLSLSVKALMRRLAESVAPSGVSVEAQAYRAVDASGVRDKSTRGEVCTSCCLIATIVRLRRSWQPGRALLVHTTTAFHIHSRGSHGSHRRALLIRLAGTARLSCKARPWRVWSGSCRHGIANHSTTDFWRLRLRAELFNIFAWRVCTIQGIPRIFHNLVPSGNISMIFGVLEPPLTPSTSAHDVQQFSLIQ